MREADRHSVLASPCSRPPARSTVRKLAPHPMWLLPLHWPFATSTREAQ